MINLQLSIRTKNAHDSRFFNILNALSDNNVLAPFFLKTLTFLCAPELEDIVEERSSKNLCGYVLCDHLNKVHSTAVVSLNVSKRKIFDIANRKKFCSDWCYAAHKNISDQIPTEPIWKNNNHIPKHDFKLYPKDAPGCGGEIYYDDNINPISENVIKTNTIKSQNKRVEKIKNVISSLDKLIVTKKKDIKEVVDEIKLNLKRNPDKKTIYVDDILTDSNMKISFPESEIICHINKAAENVYDWITDSTRDYLLFADNDKDDSEFSDDDKDSQYEGEEQHMTMPGLDCVNQNNVRKGILIKRAKLNSITSLLVEFGVDNKDFLTEFDKFVATCKLTPKNILFNAKEFRWAIILLTDVLAPKLINRLLVSKSELLKKHGLSKVSAYDDLVTKINKLINGQEILVSSQGDSLKL